jgi:hypothetical protein
MAMTPALRAPLNHQHSAAETCPYCEQVIPNDRAQEIRARFEHRRRQDEAAAKIREDLRVAEIRTQLEQSGKAQLEQQQQESAAALEQQRQDSAAAIEKLTNDFAVAWEDGKRQATAEAQQQLETMTAERDVAARKVEEAETSKAVALKQFEELKAQHDAVVVQRTAEVRLAMEQDTLEKINVLNAKHAEDTQKLSEQLVTMQRRLDVQHGEGADIKLFDVLRQSFPKDDIKVVYKGVGADILHVVKHNKKECGAIVYDSRNRNSYKTSYATNLRKDMVAAKALHSILTSSRFPDGNQQVCLREGVIVANPARVLVIVEILREEMVRNTTQRISQQDRERKSARLYDYIASQRFDNVLESLATNDEKLLALDEEEQKVHKKTWERRRLLATSSQKLHGSLRVEIDRFLGTAEAE